MAILIAIMARSFDADETPKIAAITGYHRTRLKVWQSRGDLFRLLLSLAQEQPGNSERTASDYSEHNLKTRGFLRARTTWLAVVSCVISE